MNVKILIQILLITNAVFFTSCSHRDQLRLTSPDKNILVTINTDDEGRVFYSIDYKMISVLKKSRLGIVMEDRDFSGGLKFEFASGPEHVNDQYNLLYGKKRSIVYEANKKTFHFKNSQGMPMDIIFQVSNDGVAFRYQFPGESSGMKKISRELTGFYFTDSTRTWIQPRAKAKTGWNQVNPSYEEHYLNNILLRELQPSENGWVFPVLLKANGCWVNITETWPERNYCGSHLEKGEEPEELIISFPEPTEGFTGGEVYPQSPLPWATPWRIITLGDSPGVIIESTLGTDLAEPSLLENISYVKPGRSSWSWALGKDPSVNFNTQKKFIEYAGKMGWEYCLIDVNWDTTIGWNKIRELTVLAKEHKVGLLLWYNSAGDWNTVTYHPKNKLLTPESRNAEFAKLKELGIKGIKVDFFGGDGQSMMSYYRDILEDAHKYQLMVNCHGATLPRGLQRTYPNLVSMESIRGFEYATFGQETADRVPMKSTIIPFTRNAFDPMDFTPVCFTEYDNNHRTTGNGAELAQAVIFLSGMQHYAETPKGMAGVPEYVRMFMKEIPVDWDETKYIDGYPGDFILIARRKGNTWFIAGINGKEIPRNIIFELPFHTKDQGLLVSEGNNPRSFRKHELKPDENNHIQASLGPNGGFVARWIIHDQDH
jgi:hypothetical protein